MLLPAETDERIWEYFATAGVPDEERVGKILGALANGPRTLVELESETAIRRGRLEGLLKILAVDDVVRRDGASAAPGRPKPLTAPSGGSERSERGGTSWALTGTPWTYDAARWQALAQVREREAGLMRSFARGSGCLMRFLQEALDDPNPSDCGRCSVCTGRLPAPGARPGAPRIEAARTFARGQDTVIEPRKLWPSVVTRRKARSVARKGRIVGCNEGRALAFADDPGWSDVLEPLFTQPDAPAPRAVLDGVVDVLKRWRRTWGDRPVAVVPMPSTRHPKLIRSVAEHVASVGKLPLVDALRLVGPMPLDDAASAAKVVALLDALELRPDVVVPAGPLLLVDARLRSGWSVTVAGALLRDAGASAVLPLVLHQLP